MSEMKDSNAVALDGNPEPMDQTEDNSMPSAQQQVICFAHNFWMLYSHLNGILHSFCDGITGNTALKAVQEVVLYNIIMFSSAGGSNQEEVWRTNAQKAATHFEGSFLNSFTFIPKKGMDQMAST